MSRRDETFILYYWEDYEEYEEENPTCYYCLSESTIQIILDALRFVGWATRWRLDRQDNNPRFPKGETWDKIEALGALAQKELLTDMSCDLEAGFASLAEAIENASPNNGLNALAEAVAGLKFSSGSSGSGGSSGDCACQATIINQHGGIGGTFTQGGSSQPWPIFSTEPTLSVTPGTPPEGYDTWEEYRLDKCQVANLVIDGFIGSLRGLGALGVFNYITVAGLIVLAISGAIIFPPAFIPIAAAAIGMMALEVTTLSLFANYVQDNREEWVCALYNSDSVESALSVIADLIDGIIAAIGTSSTVGLAIKQLALLLLNGDTLNQLYSEVAHLQYPDADCSSCGCENLEITQDEAYNGTWDFADGVLSMTTGPESEHSPGCEYGWVVLSFSCPVTLEFVSASGAAPGGSCSPPNQGKYQLYRDGSPVFTGNTDPDIDDRFYVDFAAYQTDSAGGTVVWNLYPYNYP